MRYFGLEFILKFSPQFLSSLLLHTYGFDDIGGLWDDAKPRIINGLKDVVYISAGLRHSAAIRSERQVDLLTWGYNGYGELGQVIKSTLPMFRVMRFNNYFHKKKHVLVTSCAFC